MLDKLDRAEIAGIRWLLGQFLVLVSLFGTYAIDLGSSLLVSVAIGMVLVATAFPFLVQSIPGMIWKIAPAFLLAGIVSDFILGGGDIIPPLFRMVVLLALYRSLQMRSPREDMQVLLLSLFLILFTGVLSLEISFGFQMLLYAPAAMGLLFAANLSSGKKRATEDDDSTPPPFYAGSWLRLARRVNKRIDRRTLFAGGILYLVTTALALMLFVLMPRFDIGAALPFPRLQTTESLTGFTDHVQYGDVVNILNDETIAMRVDVRMEEPPARPYWRMVVLDAYYDGGFMVSPKVARERRRVSNYRFDFRDYGRSSEKGGSVWTLYLEGGVSSYLPAGDTFDTLHFKNRIDLDFHDLTRVLKTNETTATTLSLRYEGLQFSGVVPVGIEDAPLLKMEPVFVDTSEPAYLSEVSYPATTLAVPSGAANNRILEEGIRAIGPVRDLSTREFSDRLVQYLRQGRGYSLQGSIPSGEADRLLRWVESGSAGHCELYAGAFVLISRYAGIPARLVTGFAGGDWNGYENYYMVRNAHAHAWCEVLDPVEGWIRVDPTPGWGTGRESVNAALAGGGLLMDRTFKAYLDSLRILWYRRVIQFDSEDQEIMAGAVRDAGSRGLDWLRESLKDWKELLKRDWKLFKAEGNWQVLVNDLLVPAAVIGAAAVLILLLRKVRKGERFERKVRRKAGALLARAPGDPDPDNPAVNDLSRIRYGPVSSWPGDPLAVIRSHRRFTSRKNAS